MEKEHILCEYIAENHKNIKKHVQDMNFCAKVVWKVAGLGDFQKKLDAEWDKYFELEEQGVEYDLDTPEVQQSGFIKLCEHKHAKM
jgi:hypothetical protein